MIDEFINRSGLVNAFDGNLIITKIYQTVGYDGGCRESAT